MTRTCECRYNRMNDLFIHKIFHQFSPLLRRLESLLKYSGLKSDVLCSTQFISIGKLGRIIKTFYWKGMSMMVHIDHHHLFSITSRMCNSVLLSECSDNISFFSVCQLAITFDPIDIFITINCGKDRDTK